MSVWDIIRKNQELNCVSKFFSALTRLGMTAHAKRFCNKKYTVQTTDANYFVIQQSLPDMFNNPSIFCAQNAGNIKRRLLILFIS